MSVFEKVKDLIGAARAREQSTRRAAGERMREILRRSENPKSGDDAILLEAINVLGIKADDLPTVAAILEKLERYEATLADDETNGSGMGSVSRAIAEVNQWASEEQAKIDRQKKRKLESLEAAWSEATVKERKVKEARQWITQSRAEWLAIVENISVEAARNVLVPMTIKSYASLTPEEKHDLDTRTEAAKVAAKG